LIAIVNGNAGWAAESPEIGICHAELMEGYRTNPSKVRVIAIEDAKTTDRAQNLRNDRFKDFVSRRSPFRGGTVNNIDELKKRVKEALFDAVLSASREGAHSGRTARADTGEALDWTRLDFKSRALKMIAFTNTPFGILNSLLGLTMPKIAVLGTTTKQMSSGCRTKL